MNFFYSFVVLKSLATLFNIIFAFIKLSKLLNFLKSNLISLSLYEIKVFLNSLSTTLSTKLLSCVAKSDNLLIDSIILGLNSFSIYGISKFLTLFLVYTFSLLDSSNLGLRFSSTQYCSILFYQFQSKA